MFDLYLYPKISLEPVQENDKRFYICPDGKKYPSVTTILNEKMPKQYLIEWKNRVGKIAAEEISTKAKNRGTRIHNLTEAFFLNRSIPKTSFDDLFTFTKIQNAMINKITNVYAVEYPLYSHKYKTAGTTDLVANYCNIPSIIDFKTSKITKKEEEIEDYFVQATIYGLMFNELYNTNIKHGVICLVPDSENVPLIFEFEFDKYRTLTERVFS